MRITLSILMIILVEFAKAEYLKPCNDSLFCYGDTLHIVQMSEIYPDSKTFVDMPLRHSDDVEKIKRLIKHATYKSELQAILKKYFSKPGTDGMIKFNSTDYKPNPSILKEIGDENYRHWAKSLCKIWNKLIRTMNGTVSNNKSKSTLIYLSQPFVVPGGRFREIYYWDTYWAIDGLCLCEMFKTAKYVLENLLHLVKEYSFVPNGGRKYYLNRSQPPFLTLMVEKYWSYTNDSQFIKDNIDVLIKEYEFWVKYRQFEIQFGGKIFQVFKYNSMLGHPRPESYKEDYKLMVKQGYLVNETAAKELYSHIASAAESGWDFSSRWFGNDRKMGTIQTRNIVPVDLNCIIYAVERILSKFNAEIIGNSTAGLIYDKRADQRNIMIHKLFWDEEYQLWLDIDLRKGKRHKNYYASTFFPFWVEKFTASSKKFENFEKALIKWKTLGIFDYPGGLPTSLIHSDQQWDFPNAWPPLQYIAVHGLRNVNSTNFKAIARKTAESFLKTAYISWKCSGYMYEKYDVRKMGDAGHGGEYKVQEGFGWTNGVVLNFLSTYGNKLQSPTPKCNDATIAKMSVFLVLGSFDFIIHFLF